MRRRLGTSLYAGLLFTVLGLVAWATGQPFVFPSLGPSAFVLAFDRRSERERAVRVVGSHLIGGLAGLAAWAGIADGAALTATPPAFSPEGFRLTASAVVSLVTTSWAMIATETVHPPACATTLIVSLGLLSTPAEVAIIVASVTVLVAFHGAVVLLFERLAGDAHPLYGRDDAGDANG
ncbi:HPP family protein [Halorubrum sp. SP9]|uniref:HPP family protein n=1 Tax=Halorubrum sp. SP9 TaxID=1537267 RepID=UPI0010F4F765|nr:HPP family protein [Halorubrum sp. SP9]TKX71138.1 HPP family protein [Halorubrum sp. SP9]